MIRLGLTGSIGMGKTTTAAMFAEEGAPVFDADAAVHALYGRGGAAVPLIARAFPAAVSRDVVDRRRLADLVMADPAQLLRLEAMVHPLVGDARAEFLARCEADGVRTVVLDIPLLFETGRADEVDATVVASAPAEQQQARVLAREGMTSERLAAVLARQMPDSEKRARADFVVDTGSGMEAARRQVRRILATLADPAWRPAPGLARAVEHPQ